jgi:RNA polymerase sigma-70 factor (ECF subfamily)
VARDGQSGQDAAQLGVLLRAVAEQQDRAAFRALFVHFAPRLKSYLVRLGSSGALAEDIVQETMLMLWRKAPLFDPSKAAVSTWVFTIARNLRIDAARREHHPELDPNDPALVPDGPDAPDAGLDQAQYDLRLREAMTRLPREQREIVELSFFADKPHAAIASELGLPLGTVKSRLRLAMGRLRISLGRQS